MSPTKTGGKEYRLVNPMEVTIATTTMVQTEEPFDEVGLQESLGEMKATPTTGLVNISVTAMLLQTLLGL